MLEQPNVVALHALQLGGEAGGEGRCIGKAAEAGKTQQLAGVLGQRLRLLVGDHLQAMLDDAQEAIGRIELVAGRGRDPAALLQPFQRHECRRRAQLRLAAAGDELLGLHEEFDLADAAAADLDVVAGHGDAAEAAEGVDLPLHGVDVGDGGEIEILAPDVGRKRLQDGLARGDVARHGPRLDQGRALPVLAEALVVVERGIRRERERGGAGVGPQPQIGAKHVAVGGALVEQPHEIAGEAHEEGLRLEAIAQADAREIVEDDEVDVGGIVELAGAVLAHGEHDVAIRIAAEPIALGGRLAEQKPHGRRNGRVGRLRQAARDVHHRPDAGEIAQRGQESDVGLEPAQHAHRRGHGLGRCHGFGHLPAAGRKALLRRGATGAQEASRIALDQLRQERRGAEDAREQSADARLGHERAETGQLRLLAAARARSARTRDARSSSCTSGAARCGCEERRVQVRNSSVVTCGEPYQDELTVPERRGGGCCLLRSCSTSG